MSLRRAQGIDMQVRGAWFFRRVWFTADAGVTFSLGGPELQRADAERRRTAALVGDAGGRRLWWVGDEFYWDTDDLSAEEVALEVWDRERRREHRYERLRVVRAREEEATSARRERIPDDVRVLVWTRDGGRCVRCGAEDDLQFDHVIPVAKGGGNAHGNIQILCGNCNRAKSDRII